MQCFVTAWRIDHRRQKRRRRRHYKSRSSSRSRETREEARQRKYRYLYQVRTARGDIISQVNSFVYFLPLQRGRQKLYDGSENYRLCKLELSSFEKLEQTREYIRMYFLECLTVNSKCPI